MQLLKQFKELTVHPKNAELLKGLILQLAIQGKLTKKWREQNPNVESAAVLLEKIQEEKVQLIKEKKIKKEKVILEVEDREIPFGIPVGWKWEKLANISVINGGFAFKSSKYVEEGVRVIRISDFDEKGFKDKKIVRYIYNSDLADYKLEEKNILMAMTGGTVGKTLFVESLEEVMVVNQRVATIKLIPLISEEYINYVIQSRLIKDIVDDAKNSTNDNISMGNIKNFFIPIPPLEEQKAIVKIVNQLLQEVQALEEQTQSRVKIKEDFVTSSLQELTTGDTDKQWSFLQGHFPTFFTEKSSVKKLRESILQLAVQGKLSRQWRADHPDTEPASVLLERIKAEKEQLIRDKKIRKEKPLPAISEYEIPYALPEGWVWCRLKEVGYITGGGTPSKSKSTYWGGNIPWISPKDMKSDYVDDSQDKVTIEGVNNSSAKIIPEGSLLIVGRSGILKRTIPVSINTVECTVNQDLKVLVPFITQMNVFIKLGLKGMEARLLRDFVKYGMTVHSLKYTEFELLTFPLPPFKEQKAIVEKVDALMALCDRLEQEIEHNTTQVELLMQSCLKEVFEQ
jgi:type I restriction enzyme S subunit